jgi:hypothetical protein
MATVLLGISPGSPHLSLDEPSDPAQPANWLPDPAGGFHPMMGLYQPGDAIFDGTYALRPIIRPSRITRAARRERWPSARGNGGIPFSPTDDRAPTTPQRRVRSRSTTR